MTDKLRIAMLSAHSCPVGNLGARDTGGMSVYIREMARELGRQGHSVDVFTRIHDPADPITVSLGERARLVHLKAGEIGDIHKLALYSYLPDFCCNLEKYRRENDLEYDLVFSHYWLSGWIGRYMQRWWQVPHFVMFHTLGAVKNGIGIGEEEPELRIVNERECVAECQRIIAATGEEKAALVSLYGAAPEKVSVIPCGVNLELFHPLDRKLARRELGLNGHKILLYVGRIEPLKGTGPLLRTMACLKDRDDLELIIVGGDDDSRAEIDRLKKLSRELGVAEAVTFQGRVHHERLPYYYSAADACVVPSYYESFGLVALEALACGTPVVAADVGDLKRIIRPGETGYVVADNSPRLLAEKIKKVLADPADAERISKSVRGYGWPDIAGAVARRALDAS